MATGKLRMALVQMSIGSNKSENIKKALHLIREAKSGGASLIALPECFNSPYGVKHFPKYGETIPNGETSLALSHSAKENDVFIIGGSIPEYDNGALYNTSTVWDPNGKLLCSHRKVHLFDINIPGGIQFKESDVLKPGNSLTTFQMGDWKVGLGICYDVRFTEMAHSYCKQGCNLLVYPGAFNMTTGPLHWELLLRARAVDNELYVAAISPAQDKEAEYVAYGHSMVIDPWGKVLSSAEFNDQIVYADMDIDIVSQMRQQIPILSQRRDDIFGK